MPKDMVAPQIVIRPFIDGSRLEYVTGRIDQWCVRYQSLNGSARIHFDVEMLAEVAAMGERFGAVKVYADFCGIYELVTPEFNDGIYHIIDSIVPEYQVDAEQTLDYAKLYLWFYMAMIAEENKANTKLGKKIKRLAVHQILLENSPPMQAAYFSKGKSANLLISICSNYGF